MVEATAEMETMRDLLACYILDSENRPVKTDLHTWGEWFSTVGNRIVGYTEINSEVRVSTVFLGTDHNYSRKGPPLLFETMVFGGELDEQMWRYSTWDDAKMNHDAIVKRLRRNVMVK